MKRLLLALSSLVTAVLVVTGCGGPSSYRPASRGPAGVCYFVFTPSECSDVGSLRPTMMPTSWHATYADYYDSPSYYNTRVPRTVRTTYITTINKFESQNAGLIKSSASRANWRGTDGSTKKGTLGKSANFDTGGSRTSKKQDSTTSRRSSGSGESGWSSRSRSSSSGSKSYGSSSSSKSGGFSSGGSRSSYRSK